MVIPTYKEEKKIVYDIKMSSVVPGKVTGESKCYELTGIDLAMKLHYIKGLYFFHNNDIKHKSYNNVSISSDANSKVTSLMNISELKKPMFDWLVPYFVTCGRIRTSPSPETGGDQPVIKLNDAGIRIVEARTDKTVGEWLAMEGFVGLGLDHLVYGDALGDQHDLGFTPLVFIQITWFKCGGISVGLSWAHVLGDVISASSFMNMLGHYIQGNQQQQIHLFPNLYKPKCQPPLKHMHEPRSLKRVNQVGDRWAVTANSNMVTHSFHLNSTQLVQLFSRVYGPQKDDKQRVFGQYFQVISAILWKSIAKIRKEFEPKVVTICKPGSNTRGKTIEPISNDQVLGTIEVEALVSRIDVLELISLFDKNMDDETNEVGELVCQENGKVDFVVYGANLTFVNMETVDIYGFKIHEKSSPAFATYVVKEVAEEGAIFLLPGKNNKKVDDVVSGKLIVVVIPEHEVQELKRELREQWNIV